MPERLIKIDAEIWEVQQKLRECEALKARLEELMKKRAEFLDELVKQARGRVNQGHG